VAATPYNIHACCGGTTEPRRRIDTPPRAFSEGFYPNLMGLYRCAGVEYVRWSWAFAATVYQQRRAFFRVGGDVSMFGFRLPALHGSFWRLLVRVSASWSSIFTAAR
jgi:hypothetical protein